MRYFIFFLTTSLLLNFSSIFADEPVDQSNETTTPTEKPISPKSDLNDFDIIENLIENNADTPNEKQEPIMPQKTIQEEKQQTYEEIPIKSEKQPFEITQNKETAFQGDLPLSTDISKGYNYPGRIDVINQWNFFTKVSFLYWQPKEQNLEFAVLRNQNVSPLRTGTIVNLKFPFEPGYKIALGVYCPCDDWDLIAEYTWTRTTQTRHVIKKPNSDGIHPFWISASNFTIADITKAKAFWRLNVNIGDILLGRSFYFGKKILLHPFFGLRGVFLPQKLTNTVTQNSIDTYSRITQRTWGLGLKTGMNTKYLLGLGFSIIGKIAFSSFYQSFKIHQKESYNVYPAELFRNIKEKESYINLNPEFSLGVDWGTYFDQDKWHANLSIFYDMQIFFDQNMMRAIMSHEDYPQVSSDIGNLMFQGLTINMKFDF